MRSDLVLLFSESWEEWGEGSGRHPLGPPVFDITRTRVIRFQTLPDVISSLCNAYSPAPSMETDHDSAASVIHFHNSLRRPDVHPDLRWKHNSVILLLCIVW